MVHASERLAPHSKRGYAAAVRSFVAFAGVDERRWAPTVVQGWRDSLRGVVAPQTVNTMLRGLRFAFKRFKAMGHGDDAASPIEYVAETGKRRKPDALAADQALRLLATVEGDASFAGRRDHVILCLGLIEGFRREEMVRLRWEQFDATQLMDVLRKGGERADHTIDARTRSALLFLGTDGEHSPRADDPILTRARPCIGCPVRPLSTSAIYGIVRERARQAGLRVAPHELRHTCGSLALEAGVDPWRVAKHLNHADVRTTIGTYAHDLKARDGEPVGQAIRALLGREG